ncbi:MAG: formate--tetrahydrofolate ligase [Candidatus Omnitrophica bacterium]|nr:formate--tetrahydrofolate ligase [Candidatus Omnitrophota bacterium]
MKLQPITKIARRIGIRPEELELFGNHKAKVSLSILERLNSRRLGRYILVTAMTPTPLGEGKTVTTLGLSLGLNRIGHRSICTLRQPSLGPIFGVKGGATGGGMAQVLPSDEINLHLTGDFHAIGLAHNLLAAYLDHSVYRGNRLNIDRSSLDIRRVMDMNDRSLRHFRVSPSGKLEDEFTYESGFDITAASEVMALVALSRDIPDLRRRLGQVIVAYTKEGQPITAEGLQIAGAMAAILRDAIKPNLLQTSEGTACLIHTGPFGNISHGTNSILADQIALRLSDYVVTEAGFGADLGGEKFCDIKCRASGMKPDAAVVVCTIRGLKHHGEGDLAKGCSNLIKQIANVKLFGIPAVVGINRFADDTEQELAFVRDQALAHGAADAQINEAFLKGSKGAEALARAVSKAAAQKNDFRFLYSLKDSVEKKIETIATRVYGAEKVEYSDLARERIAFYQKLGFENLPICMAKTHLSLSHDAKLKGAPSGFTLPIRDIRVAAGAGYLFPMCGAILTMPGFSEEPRGKEIDLDPTGKVIGI